MDLVSNYVIINYMNKHKDDYEPFTTWTKWINNKELIANIPKINKAVTYKK